MTKISVTPDEFRTFAQYILEISGIALDKGKEYLLETRLNPLLGKYGCKSYAELLRRSKTDFKKVAKRWEDSLADVSSCLRSVSPAELDQAKLLSEAKWW